MTAGLPISEDDLHAYVDGRLDANRHAQVEAYLRINPAVARRVDEFGRQRAELRETLGPIAREPVPPELNLRRMVEVRRAPQMTTWRSAAAAAILLLVGGAAGWFGHAFSQAPASGITALAQEASQSYQVYGADGFRPVELRAGESRELIDWMSERLRHSVIAPDLTASGYRFMGGRLVATAHGPAGMFMYDDDRGTRLVMLIRPMAVEKTTPMSPYQSGGTSGIAWAQNGIGYSLVGRARPEILHPLADEVRRQIART